MKEKPFATRVGVLLLPVLLACSLMPASVQAARKARERVKEKTEGDFAAGRLLQKAQDLLAAKEYERGVKMLQTLIEQYPESLIRYKAFLALGKHFLEVHNQEEAVRSLGKLKELKKPNEEMDEEQQELYVESLYLTGIAYFQSRQYNAAFPVLRQITRDYPNTVWANQAYYYIGMCHFSQENWNKAIEALSLVGTFVDASSPSVRYVEAGRRFYLKIEDGDLPVLTALGGKVRADLETRSGDKESVLCVPLSGKGDIYIGSVPTEVGVAKPGDQTLQVLSDDAITTTYTDENTVRGERNIQRSYVAEVVSSGTLGFTLGTFESSASAAFLGQPLYLLVSDADRDTSPEAETVKVKVFSRYAVVQAEEGEADAPRGIDVEKLLRKEKDKDEEQFKVRDEVTIELRELGDAPVHTGMFGGRVLVQGVAEEVAGDKSDSVLSSALNDEVVASYIDSRHLGGSYAREVLARTSVAGEIDARPRATQNIVFDETIKARKNLVEAAAYLELGRIFRSMGLLQGARERCNQGLQNVEPVIRTEVPIPADLKERSFQLKWELQLAMGEYAAAIATCQFFNRLYPDSPLVDHALMEIGNAHLEKKNFADAIGVFRQILQLPASQVKAEAQFRIAQALESDEAAPAAALAKAIPEYQACAERFPDSEFAGPSLAKLIDYHVATKDYGQANALLEQIAQDYPDARFMDNMLIKWVIVAYSMGDVAKAKDKCSQLLFEYPSSPHAAKAKTILPKIEEKVRKASPSTKAVDEGN
ncbi:MAG: tetratricopeptide repeat protein [Planctomycetes bacterium]|nr:tetratricopeptide repeat protein [Planctomycetota bacterium]